MSGFKYNGPPEHRAHALAMHNAREDLINAGHEIIAIDGQDVDHDTITYRNGDTGKTECLDVKS
jgi:hypothetical protein